VVSDDCSTDGTFDRIVATIEGTPHRKNVFAHRNERNLGVSRHLQQRLAEYRDELIIFQGGDDISTLERAEVVYGMSKEYPYATLFASAYRTIDENGAETNQVSIGAFEDRLAGLRAYLDQRTPVPVPGAAMSISMRQLDVFGPHDPGILWEDHVFYFRALLLGGVAVSTRTLVSYRRHSHSLSCELRGRASDDEATAWKREYLASERSAINLYRLCRQNIADLAVAEGAGVIAKRDAEELSSVLSSEERRRFLAYRTFVTGGFRRVPAGLKGAIRVFFAGASAQLLAPYIGVDRAWVVERVARPFRRWSRRATRVLRRLSRLLRRTVASLR